MLTKPNSKKVVLEGDLSINIIKNKDDFLAECRELDLFTWGETEEEAVNEIEKVISLFLEEIISTEKSVEVLVGLGWQIKENEEEIIISTPFVIKTKKLPLNKRQYA